MQILSRHEDQQGAQKSQELPWQLTPVSPPLSKRSGAMLLHARAALFLWLYPLISFCLPLSLSVSLSLFLALSSPLSPYPYPPYYPPSKPPTSCHQPSLAHPPRFALANCTSASAGPSFLCVSSVPRNEAPAPSPPHMQVTLCHGTWGASSTKNAGSDVNHTACELGVMVGRADRPAGT